MNIDKLYRIIENRKNKMTNNSYVASLFRQGTDKIIQKVGEEATEVVITSKNGDKKQIIYESADLLFHLLVLLKSFDISPDDIMNELQKRVK
jgi:phosphoribosyl-ATP pyrophosphohydrolase